MAFSFSSGRLTSEVGNVNRLMIASWPFRCSEVQGRGAQGSKSVGVDFPLARILNHTVGFSPYCSTEMIRNHRRPHHSSIEVRCGCSVQLARHSISSVHPSYLLIYYSCMVVLGELHLPHPTWLPPARRLEDKGLRYVLRVFLICSHMLPAGREHQLRFQLSSSDVY